MMIRKHSFTLLELLISMTLTLLIISTLSYFYYQANYENIKMDQAQNESFERRYVENRLASVLPRAISSKDNQNGFHFFSSPNLGGLFKENSSSLVFTFDNCVKLNKNFTYHVIGRLFLDQEGNFTLAMWPSQKRWKEDEIPPIHREVLFTGVEGLSFSFFIPLEKGQIEEKKQGELPTESVGRWTDDWEKEYRQLPAIMKVILTLKGGEKRTFAFPLPHARQPITYDG